MTLSGPASLVAVADASGNFSFAGLANGTYTVTPSKSGYSFTPSSQSVVINNADVSAWRSRWRRHRSPSTDDVDRSIEQGDDDRQSGVLHHAGG